MNLGKTVPTSKWEMNQKTQNYKFMKLKDARSLNKYLRTRISEEGTTKRVIYTENVKEKSYKHT